MTPYKRRALQLTAGAIVVLVCMALIGVFIGAQINHHCAVLLEQNKLPGYRACLIDKDYFNTFLSLALVGVSFGLLSLKYKINRK